ncbi:MAG: Ig-like domain-containing protein [Prevotellaceae bacterium]|nr:Ig-like domain-containing protein [Prevotellaceae bacterium]
MAITLLLNAPAYAGWNIQSGKQYYITCNYTSGFVALGSYQGSSYDVYYQTAPATPTSDGYWYISKGSEGYVFQNCASGQYLSWTSEYNTDKCKYLTLTDEVSGTDEEWTITQGSGFVSIRSVAQPNYQFNLRTSTYMMGCYKSTSNDYNEQFNIYDSSGAAIVYSEIDSYVESITIEAEQAEIEEGESLQLHATVSPSDATDPSVIWSSSDESVATVSKSGLVTALSQGKTTITATANDGHGATGSIEISVKKSSYVEHSDEMLYLRRADSTMLMIPCDYVTDYSYSGSLFTATLVDGADLTLWSIVEVSEDTPADLPAFSSYKFNNKYNSQVFTDVESDNPGKDTISLSVGCIGKWLTASFQLTAEGTKAWVDGVRQQSKKTRQSFANPVTYELTNSYWQTLRLKMEADGTYTREYADYSRKVTVSVDFLSDHPTSQYGVPRIDITLSNTGSWSSSNWIGKNGKSYYETASIAIDGAGVFPDMESTPIQIKGRGNTTWSDSYRSKNPYHFKFSTKQKPLGMKSGKHWILLSNKQTGSMTTNAMGHKVGNLLETAGTNHVVPVELYINGSYRGSYDLTERIGFSNNSIDLDDDTYAAMIEMDTYTDETIYKSNAYSLPAKIHIPDIGEEGVTLTSSQIISDFNSMVSAVHTGTDSFLHQVDPDYLARYLLACEYIVNCELDHPKSVFLYSENVTDELNADGDDETPWIYGPIWDCDWAFGYENTKSYYIYDADLDLYSYLKKNGTSKGVAGQFFSALRYNSTAVDRIYYELMYNFVNKGGLDELVDYCDEYYSFAASAFQHNSSNETSERDGTNYATMATNSKSWFSKRATYILGTLTPYDITDEEEEEDTNTSDKMGDVNDDGAVSVSDLVCVLNYLAGLENETFISSRADTDSNGEIDDLDVELLCDTIMERQSDINRNLHLPTADISLQMENTACLPNSDGSLPLTLSVDEGQYSALQMDLHLPEGVELDGVTLPSELSDMNSRSKLIEDGKYRVIIYGDGSCLLPEEPSTFHFKLQTGEAVSGYAYITGVLASTSLGEEQRLPCTGCSLIVTDDAAGIRNARDKEETPNSTNGIIYDLSGRRVSDAQAAQRHGIYIINGKKVVR